jgi:hypothetical protein
MLVFVLAIWGVKPAFRNGDLFVQQAISVLAVISGLVALVTKIGGWPPAAVRTWSQGATHAAMPWYRRLLPYLLLLGPPPFQRER